MKHKILIAGFVAICLASCSSTEFEIKENEVPVNVVSAFKAKYPNAQVTKWVAEKEDDRFYFEAKINDGGKEREVHITADGSSVTEED